MHVYQQLLAGYVQVVQSVRMCVGDLALLQHDKPLAKGNSAPHLKHIPAYLRDPTIAIPSFPGNAGKGQDMLKTFKM